MRLVERECGDIRLTLKQTPVDDLDGNTLGYGIGRKVAINPVAAMDVSSWVMHNKGDWAETARLARQNLTLCEQLRAAFAWTS